MKMLQDQNGNISSKRILALMGFLVAAIIAIVALIMDSKADIAVELTKAFLAFSATLAGVSVAEFFKRPQ